MDLKEEDLLAVTCEMVKLTEYPGKLKKVMNLARDTTTKKTKAKFEVCGHQRNDDSGTSNLPL